MQTRIDPDATLLAITDSYPETVPVFVAQGFPQMAEDRKRKLFGGAISLRQATSMKNLDLGGLLGLLEDVLPDEPNRCSDPTTATRPIRIAGLLPCPVRIPLEEAFAEFRETYSADHGCAIEAELQAASVGASWIHDHVTNINDPDALPDLFISAGFETFFDPNGIGRFRDIFEDRAPFAEFNSCFDGIDLKDPEGRYSIISVVPAVFLVNTNEFGDQPLPRTWADILEPRFEQRVSLPVGDFDLFSGILLAIRQRYGDDGVRKLGRSLMKSLHPAQMVKVAAKPNPPMVTIMPYFFTRMAQPGSPMQAVWPEDGAIISPIFLLAKKTAAASGGADLQPIIDFFCSREVAEILAVKGLFPSTRPDVDNGLNHGETFSWLGWDYVATADITADIARCQKLFDEGRRDQ